MVKFAAEGSTLVVRFSLGEMTVSHHRTLRIPLSLVDSVTVDPDPWKWLSQHLKLTKPPIPEVMQRIADHAVPGPSIPTPQYPSFEGGSTYVGGELVKLVGPRGAQIFARFNPHLPAIRVNLTKAAPFIGFLVAHRDPEAWLAWWHGAPPPST